MLRLARKLTSSRIARGLSSKPRFGDPFQAAIDWVHVNQLTDGGIAVSSDQQVSYPEVTGYLIPTLLECGERDLALELARWLISIQRPDGGFGGPTEPDESYLFDTGQVLRGFVAVADLLPEVHDPLRRAADCLVQGGVDGVVRPRPDSRWVQRYGWRISHSIHLYTLPPLIECARLLGRPDYVEIVEKSLDYYLHHTPDLLEFRFLTHFYGYVLEALVDLGRDDLARRGLQPIIEAQSAQGAIPGVPGARWVCTPGAFQMAIVGYKLGLRDFAGLALEYMRGFQMRSGGFLGSYGPGAAYAQNGELSWACKYFLDACNWRTRTRLAG
jgi:hypothetical protein